jgi:hypothetical protein
MLILTPPVEKAHSFFGTLDTGTSDSDVPIFDALKSEYSTTILCNRRVLRAVAILPTTVSVKCFNCTVSFVANASTRLQQISAKTQTRRVEGGRS